MDYMNTEDMREEAERLYQDAQNMYVQELGRGYRIVRNRKVFRGEKLVTDFDSEREPEYEMAQARG